MTLPRYRRRDPLDALRYLLQTGVRPATSLEEARAAAYVDSRLRRAGLSVSADTFRAPDTPGLTFALLVLPGLCAALLGVFAGPLPAFWLALYGLMLTFTDALAMPLPLVARTRDSQNIVAARARVGEYQTATPPPPRWRLVLLTPLDTPRQQHGLAMLQGRNAPAQVGRMLAYALLFGLLVLLQMMPTLVWQVALLVPLAYLIFAALPPGTHIDDAALFGSSGALAVALAAVEQLRTLERVEVWMVALGSTSTSERGLLDLLRRYPFPHSSTLLVALPHLGDGELVQITHEGLLRQHTADPLLRELVDEVSTNLSRDEVLREVMRPLPKRPAASSAGLASVLYRRGYRTITLRTINDPPPTIPEDEAMSISISGCSTPPPA
ncbi:MAG: hypothetical protein HC914_02555 [Chloroflexaceae bacterium]|nr:hypothetical protein [Chloroflexaceae bacterium]